MTATDFGPWAAYALSADSLEGCLQRASRSLQYHQTGSTLTLTSDGELARYTYRLDGPSGLDHRQHGDHVLPALLAAIRRYAGQTWRPSWLEIKSLGERGIGALQDVVGCEVRSRAEALTIVFPAALLRARVAAGNPFEASAKGHGLRQIARARPPQTLSATVVEIAHARMIDRRFDLEGVARKLNVGVRTLQRRLDKEGVGYRRLLQHVRLREAIDFLTQTDHPVTEIALALGYDDPAHFSRAFRSATSLAPSRYRELARARLS